MRKWRDIAIEAPDTAEDLNFPVPEGMKAWRNRNGFSVVACHYSSDPLKRNDAWYAEACKGLRPDQIARELELDFHSKAGTKAFSFLEHHAKIYRIDPPNPIPAGWKIIVGMDYGSRNPTSIHWYAVDTFRRFWAFDEFYMPLKNYKGGLPELCRYLRAHPYYERCQKIVADPKIFAKDQNIITKETGMKAMGTVMSIAELMQKEKIHKLQRGNNDRYAGLERVRTMLNWCGPEETKPAFYIGTKCNKMWWEYCNLVHKLDATDTKNPEEDIVKRHDHAFDESKYALLSEDVAAEFVGSRKAGTETLKDIEDEIDERYNQEKGDQYSCTFRELDGEEYSENY